MIDKRNIVARTKRAREIAARRENAAQAVAHAIDRGILPVPTTLKCFDCGKPATCYDHRDYAKPLQVWPVCKSCDVRRGAASPYDGKSKWWNDRMVKTKKLVHPRTATPLREKRIPTEHLALGMKLYEYRKLQAKKLISSGMTRREVARTLGISRNRVYQMFPVPKGLAKKVAAAKRKATQDHYKKLLAEMKL